MRWCLTIFALGLLAQTIADPGPDPDPKKYKEETKEKTTKITAEEKAFLKEVEAKFGVSSEKPQKEEKRPEKVEETVEGPPQPFPAVIAIEIVNDTGIEGKEKRTVDANLGYGYRTNNGYTYTYFGKPKQEQGKFMIYPYSQEDIPPPRPSQNIFGSIHRPPYQHQTLTQPHYKFSSQYSLKTPNVEIQPSQAYELVPATEETPSTYNSREHVSELKTEYEKVKGLETPPPPPQYSLGESQEYAQPRVPSTLYTTYNGGHLSGLTGHFPAVMSNYFVDSSQLLRNPQFQNVGLTSDYLRQHGPSVDQRVVPVLVLRIPSSHLRNPSADLYPNLPSNFPLSNYLNNVNLQDLVAQYFKKIGYPHVPQVMTHYRSPFSATTQYRNPAASPITQYMAPVSPSHYSPPAVAPFTRYQSPSPASAITHYQIHNAAAPITYYQSQSAASPITHYQSQTSSAPATQYETQPSVAPISQYQTQHYAVPEPQPTYTHVDYSGVQYSAVQPVMAKYPSMTGQLSAGQHFMIQNPHTGQQTLYQYVQPSSGNFKQYLEAEYQNPHYQAPKFEFQYVESPAQPDGGQDQATDAAPQYETSKQAEVQPRGHASYGPPKEVEDQSSSGHSAEAGQTSQQYAHHQSNENSVSESTYATPEPQKQSEESVSISENYPSKDHTHVTVIPNNYKSLKQLGGDQSVSYVTPSPLRSKYHPFKIMAPQSVLGAQQGVSYINSHSVPSSSYRTASYSQEYNPEQEQTADVSYLPPVSSQKAPSYPRNYHSRPSHQKRMTHKQEAKAISLSAEKADSTEKQSST